MKSYFKGHVKGKWYITLEPKLKNVAVRKQPQYIRNIAASHVSLSWFTKNLKGKQFPFS